MRTILCDVGALGSTNAPEILRAATRAELVAISTWLEGGLGGTLEGDVYRAGPRPLPS